MELYSHGYAIHMQDVIYNKQHHFHSPLIPFHCQNSEGSLQLCSYSYIQNESTEALHMTFRDQNLMSFCTTVELAITQEQ